MAGGGNLAIEARINQIDWPPTNIIGCKTLKFDIVIAQISVNEILVDRTTSAGSCRSSMHDEIALVCFGVKYFIYMFRVWGINMVMFASGSVCSSEVKLRQQLGISRSRPVCASRLLLVAFSADAR